MGIFNVFVALDRLIAIRKPVLYSRLFRTIRYTTIVLIVVLFLVCFVIYTVTRSSRADDTNGYLFTHFVNRTVQDAIHLSTVAIFICSLLVTLVFLHDFHSFLAQRNRSHMTVYTKSAITASRIVLYLMSFEFTCLVIPNSLKIILSKYFNINMAAAFGPINHPFFVLYMTVSSLMILISFQARRKTTPSSIVLTARTASRYKCPKIKPTRQLEK
ncbi:hypothetical protein L596_026352 [Steinernema carpocapsae]|uniref:G-protein coupled receptors family 1 profile domain-containing protein n=1 Tax=Steinernema carpocapsae TaxID=34508 RepID=A0A4U5M153_STECR|nr:hypothetical protein L596_026352 [Steinernema carpocapsae]